MPKNHILLKNVFLTTALAIVGYKGAVWLGRKAIDRANDSFVHRIMVDAYSENLWEFVSASRRTGLQKIVETNLRAQEGKLIKRPLGSPKKIPSFEGIMFNFAQLHRLTTDEGAHIDTSVTIGPCAQRPLQIEMPIMISGMAYALALSAKAKIALAKGSKMAGTATNTGEGPFLPEERKAAGKLIIQYNRGKWNKSEDILKQADMIEIHIGQGAAGGVGHYIEDKEIDWKIRRMMGLSWGEKAVVHATYPGIKKHNNLNDLVTYLKEVTQGVPIGVKLAASKYLEDDLKIAYASGVDFFTLDGSKGASKGTAPILQDDFGLPTLFAVVRAANFISKHGLNNKVSLIVSGGLATPGDYLKALALGADAVYIGSMALFAMSHTQVLKPFPFEPPPELIWYKGKYQHKLDVDKGAKNLAKYLLSCNEEIKDAVKALGKKSIHEINKSDLFALDDFTAKVAGIPLGYKEISYEATQPTT
ncbi:FMN-binding glutamate synthase family protein [Desulfoscipio gibsoniae]|uniref:Glutamate synthase family protein n=1 Tax=Desulfoscipio gibsoniae DSM 7213 TaxID=767817 RepID=R4KER1_9FIRM|nr:FMN-binding glutamate synthase family protein [Desulfoscipio gibsoniae]AGL01069.1 glutamate synthase family protein [Desulfoscipio gibsoniae DSM 7213]